MARLIYPILFVSVAALAAMQWSQHRGSSQLMAWLQPKTAAAQSPDEQYVPAPSWPYTGNTRNVPWPAAQAEPSGPRPETQEPPAFEEPIRATPPPANRAQEIDLYQHQETPRIRPTDQWDSDFARRNLESEPRMAARPGQPPATPPTPQRLNWTPGVSTTIEGTLLRGGRLEVFTLNGKPVPVTRIQLDQSHWPPTAKVALRGYITPEQGQVAPTFIVERVLEPNTLTVLGAPPANAPSNANQYSEYPSTGYVDPAADASQPSRESNYRSRYDRPSESRYDRPANESRYEREPSRPPVANQYEPPAYRQRNEPAEASIADGPGTAGIASTSPRPSRSYRDTPASDYRSDYRKPRQTERVARTEQPTPSAPDTSAPTGPAPAKPWIEDTVIVAIVNSEAILAGDVRPMVDQQVALNISKIPPDQIDEVRKMLMSQALEPIIRRKLLFQDAKRDIPKDAWGNVEDQLDTHFEERIELIMKKQNIVTRADFEKKLTQQGQSLEQQRRVFIEESLARQWLQKNVTVNDEVGRDDLLNYYRDNIADYEIKAQARWQQISIRKDKHASREAALFAIGRLGNRVLDNEPFESVARDSDAPTDDGMRDWTTKGSLVAKDLDSALFSLPVGSLSQVIEDDRYFHIVRVLERKEAGREPFEETQTAIRKKILEERKQVKQKEYLDQLLRGSHIWRLFGEPKARDNKPEPEKPSRY